MVGTEEMNQMVVDISNGAVEPPSWYNKEQRDQWERLLRQIREIKAKGGMVDIPFD